MIKPFSIPLTPNSSSTASTPTITSTSVNSPLAYSSSPNSPLFDSPIVSSPLFDLSTSTSGSSTASLLSIDMNDSLEEPFYDLSESINENKDISEEMIINFLNGSNEEVFQASRRYITFINARFLEGNEAPLLEQSDNALFTLNLFTHGITARSINVQDINIAFEKGATATLGKLSKLGTLNNKQIKPEKDLSSVIDDIAETPEDLMEEVETQKNLAYIFKSSIAVQMHTKNLPSPSPTQQYMMGAEEIMLHKTPYILFYLVLIESKEKALNQSDILNFINYSDTPTAQAIKYAITFSLGLDKLSYICHEFRLSDYLLGPIFVD